ncbi:hypothetical protein NLI96_g560 [Meripilus lineatus]|uniref:RING-type domain-containing protein n=1 Tax=Meripilus lineatus TaxID=2056292 RepID=A0AAD5YIE0_9APHY|nr:hypothetical protein NLI96_g560 [Physisporinus lineatus]
MKPSNWIPKSQSQNNSSHQLPSSSSSFASHSFINDVDSNTHLLPPPSTPRAGAKHNSITATFRSVFYRSPARATSATSLNSAVDSSSSHPDPSSSSSPFNNSSSSTNPDSRSHIHPYATMVAAPLPVVSSHDMSEDEDECPVCLEPLSFSFRLPGEKPHIVPECGHALHEACFTAVYGPPPSSNRAGGVLRKSNLGVCGVCRRPMKVGDGDGGKSNKLAALTGMNKESDTLFPGRDGPTPNGRNPPHHGRANHVKPYDPNEDDPVDHGHHSIKSGYSLDHQHSTYVVAPSIQVRSEFSSLTRSTDPTQPLTCIVVVELPGKRPNAHVPGSTVPVPDNYSQRTATTSNGAHHLHNGTAHSSPRTEYSLQRQQQHQQMPSDFSHTTSSTNPRSFHHHLSPQQSHDHAQTQHHMSPSNSYDPPSYERREAPPSQSSSAGPSGPGTTHSSSGASSTVVGPAPGGSGAIQPVIQHEEDVNSPFTAITEDLRNRIIDWKGHPLSGLGPLQMYDLLSVRRDSLVREFFVYLFKEAIICVVEERKRTLGRLLSSASGGASFGGSSGDVFGMGQGPSSKGVLRLKGRIYIRHIRQVTDTSVSGEMSLTINMEDERLDSFILIYKDRSSLETWKAHIHSLVAVYQSQHSQAAHLSSNSSNSQYQPGGQPDLEEFGGSAKAMRMLSGSTGTTVSTVDSLLHSSSRSTLSSNTSHGSASSNHNHNHNNNYNNYSNSSTPRALGGGGGGAFANQQQTPQQSTYGGAGGYPQKLAPMVEEDEDAMTMLSSRYGGSTPLVTPHLSSGPSNSLAPLPHPPMDLIVVVSVPGPNATPSTAALKLRVIKTSLDFIVAGLGGKDRLSLVTFEVGVGGKVRKTPFLSVGNAFSRGRLNKFVDEIGGRGGVVGAEGEDEFVVRQAGEDKTDVVTAVNHGLDVVLQRKSRNPVSGMVLVSDASDTTRRAQMDLVLARAEAANVPIHSFGYGRSHDPASLWLMSNHTSGTYTFVKDWYDLRDCLAGCIGGMMSIGISGMKMHIKIVDGQRFRIRKISGGPSAILSSDGRDVDVEVGEVHYGERKEMLVELELDNSDVVLSGGAGSAHQRGSDSLLPGHHTPPNHHANSSANGHGHGHGGRTMNATDQFNQRMGLDALSIGDVPDLADGMMDRMIDEVPVFEVDGSFFDPQASKHVSRLAHPVLLTVTLLPNSMGGGGAGSRPRSPLNPPSDPIIVRRRMELLASDMITRALVLVSRKNYPQAQKLLGETRRILHTVLQNITAGLPPPGSSAGRDGLGGMNGMGGVVGRNRKDMLALSAVRAIQGVLQDMQILAEALEENVELFGLDQRNFGAQQAMVLRDQKSWSGRSAIERLFWTIDNSIELVSRSTDWVARE